MNVGDKRKKRARAVKDKMFRKKKDILQRNLKKLEEFQKELNEPKHDGSGIIE